MNLLKALVVAIGAVGVFIFVQAAPAMAQTSPEITQGLCAGANLDINDPNCRGGNEATDRFNDIIRTIINLLSLVVGVVAVIMIMIGGLRYITSGGSDTGVTGAKNTILYAIIGLIIVLLAQIMVRFVLGRLAA